MNINNIQKYHDKFMQAAGTKVRSSMKDILKSGNRNVKGLQFSTQRILQSAENFFFSLGSSDHYDPVKAIYKSFSEKPGLANVGNIAGVDVVDINIAATQQSVLGYLCAERGLENVTQQLWFQGLKNMNEVGGFQRNSWVNNPYSPMSKNIRAALKGAWEEVELTGDKTVKLSELVGNEGQVLLNTLQVVKPASGATPAKVVGKYVDGEIYFNDGASKATIEGDNINFTIGSGNTYKLVVGIDKSTEKDGKHTLKVKPGNQYMSVTAEPRRIHLEESYEDNAYMNKQAFKLSQSGITQDYGRIAVNQLLDTYVQFLDFDAVMTTAEAVTAFNESPTLDMGNYLMTTSQADTKNDIMHSHMIKLNEDLQTKSKYGYTALLVDSRAASILGNNKDHFTANAAFNDALDGLIGTYDGKPVIRHHALNGWFDGSDGDDNSIYGVIIAIYKAPSAALAPTVYAEYLPPYSAVPALNFDNAAQFSHELLSMSVCKPITPELEIELGTWMKVKLATE